ncbi:YceI family protein [Formosa agariphila]|nr:YceI family protein [Formosa agariphila]
MKNTVKITMLLVLAITVASFSTLKTKNVNIKESQITWTGHKVTGQHDGTLTLKDGALEFNNKQLIGGEFTMDMTSINTTDLEGKSKAKLDGHLKSDDFFGTEKYPTATLKFTEVKGQGTDYTVTGDLTVKGITKPITFNMTVAEGSAKAAFKIDRTKYGIKYGSASFFDDLQDKAIYNEFDLNVALKF